MKILSMTATFGKLSHAKLTLEPGLNVIHAPNEWGKSTWCAFIVAMLYGIDTRERTTQTTLADKERYAPWAGEAMSGRMDILWQGRNITIERSSKGRTPFGEFRAYETGSGLPVVELTAANCGEMLLGVEKSVFTRTAFLRLTDLPVTQDESLRRRLNALVTTGDENGDSDALEQKLRDLKNRCRHNKTGLLPQAEAQRNVLRDRLSQLRQLKVQGQQLQVRQQELEQELQALENHKAALAYTAAQQDIARLESAEKACAAAQETVTELQKAVSQHPSKEETQKKLSQMEQLKLQQAALEGEVLPDMPDVPTPPAPFAGLSPEQACQQATRDKADYDRCLKPVSALLPALAGLCVAVAIWILFALPVAAIPLALLAVCFIGIFAKKKTTQAKKKAELENRYQSLAPEQWIPAAQDFLEAMLVFSQSDVARKAIRQTLDSRKQSLLQATAQITGGEPLEICMDTCHRILAAYEDLAAAKADWERASSRLTELSSLIKPASPPAEEDNLTLSQAETIRVLAELSAEHRQLHQQYGQCLGQMETLGQEETLTVQLSQVEARIEALENTYTALTVAMETVHVASAELQRRFAPRISQRAQALFARLTDNRYDRLHLTRDLQLAAGAADEDTVRAPLWRSEGTVDQLYLALRLAVAEELTPDAPLVLDDAFVRFDDTRLQKAMEILKEEAEEKQVVLFTCQGREKV